MPMNLVDGPDTDSCGLVAAAKDLHAWPWLGGMGNTGIIRFRMLTGGLPIAEQTGAGGGTEATLVG